jgi:hypothetical protein
MDYDKKSLCCNNCSIGYQKTYKKIAEKRCLYTFELSEWNKRRWRRGLWKLLSYEKFLPLVQSRLTEIIKIFWNPSVQSINQRNKRSVSRQSDQDHGLN